SSTVAATTPIYTLSLHDALPISRVQPVCAQRGLKSRYLGSDRLACAMPTIHCHRCGGFIHNSEGTTYRAPSASHAPAIPRSALRSEEHTSELQSLRHLVCRLLLE